MTNEEQRPDLQQALQQLRAQAREVSDEWCTGSPWRTEFCVHGDGRLVTHHVVDASGDTLVSTESTRIAQAPQVHTCRDKALASITRHMANFSPDVAVAMLDVIDAARVFRLADTGGTFNDRVATGEALDGMLASLTTLLGAEARRSKETP